MSRKSYILAVFALIAFVITMALSVELWRYKAAQKEALLTHSHETTQAITSELEALLKGVQAKADAMGETFGEREYSIKEIEDIILEASLANSEIRGVTVCYEPYAYDTETKLFCPYYSKASSEFLYIEESYDYTVKSDGTTWYTGVIEAGAKWAKPYYGAAAGDWFIDYGVPFYWTSGERKGQIRGIIDFTLSAEDFKNFVHEVSVGKTGYSFLITSNGDFVTHPISEYVGNENLSLIISEENQPKLETAYISMLNGENGYTNFYDEDYEQNGIFHFQTLDVANYRIGITFFADNLLAAPDRTSRRIVNIALVFSIFLVLLIAMIFGRDILDRTEIEQLSIITSTLLVGLVVLIGGLQHSKSRDFKVDESPAIIDNSGLGAFIQDVERQADVTKRTSPTTVPTGLYIENLEFTDSYNVNIGGQVWMKYPPEIANDETLNFGVRFPQMSPFAEASLLEEVHREIVPAQEGESGYLHIIWDFRVTLRLNLEYGDFPFDKRHLDIELDPASMDDNIILVPDLTSYTNTTPTRLPGVSEDIKLPGSEITKSYFNFAFQNYATDFGYGSKAMFQKVPTLHFNINLKRKLLNPFITYLVPIFVVLSLIYILILACEKTEARQGIIESMAAFFFVLIFSHIDLRKDVVTPDLIYIEYFYFATYLMIILSTANLIAYTKSQTLLFDFNNNQIYRTLYFPLFLSAILVISLWKFY